MTSKPVEITTSCHALQRNLPIFAAGSMYIVGADRVAVVVQCGALSGELSMCGRSAAMDDGECEGMASWPLKCEENGNEGCRCSTRRGLRFKAKKTSRSLMG